MEEREGGEDGGSSWSMEGGSPLIEKPWEEAWTSAAMVAGAQAASCKGGRHSEQTLGSLRWSWAREEVESWVGDQGTPVGQEAWGKADALGTGLENQETGNVLEECIAYNRNAEACSCCFRGSQKWEESEYHSGTGVQEAGEGVVSGWWVCSFAGSHAGRGASQPWDTLDPDGMT